MLPCLGSTEEMRVGIKLFLLSLKAWCKKVWAWCKKYWQILLGASIPVLIWILSRNSDHLNEILQRVQDDHKKEVDAIDAERLREIERLENASEEYVRTIKDIEKKYSELSGQLEENKKQKIEELLKESEEDPDVLTRKISEIMGFDLYI